MIAGKFRVERLLGEGGMGLVFLAEHLDLEQNVAIKIVRDELTLREDVVERLLREARTAARLRSDHVARVLDAGRIEGGTPYIVMEYLEGCDLDELLVKRGPLPAEEAVGFVLQACEGIAEAHALGVVHRDLKPENLFLTTRTDGTPIVKVLDFGISKSTEASSRSLTNPTMVVGSPDYMSPEQMQGRDCAGPETDIWSLGAVLYALVTSRRPFEAETVQGVYARVLAQEPLTPGALAELPEGLSDVILRCLKKKASERYPSVAELARALATFGPPGSIELAASIGRVAIARRHREQSAPELSPAILEAPPSRPRRECISPLSTPTPNLPQPFATTVGAPFPLPRLHGRQRTLLWAGAIAFSAAALIFGWAALGARSREPFRGSDRSLGEMAKPEAPEPERRAAPHVVEPLPTESLGHSSASVTPPAESASAHASPPRKKQVEPVLASPPSPAKKPDPWNPDTFGGRM